MNTTMEVYEGQVRKFFQKKVLEFDQGLAMKNFLSSAFTSNCIQNDQSSRLNQSLRLNQSSRLNQSILKTMAGVATIVVPVFCVLIVVGNASTILSFMLKRRLRKNPSYWYITSLAASDVLIGSITIPLHLYSRNGFFAPVERTSSPMPSNSVCNSLVGSYVMTVAPHIHHLMVLSVDRYIKLTSPLWYRKVMTIERAVSILTAIWILGGVVNLFLLFPDHIFIGDCLNFRMKIINYSPDHCWMATILVVHIPCFFLVACNVRVFMIATKYKAAIENELKAGKKLDDTISLRYHRGSVIVDPAVPTLNCLKGQKHRTDRRTDRRTFVSLNTSLNTSSDGSARGTELIRSRKMEDWLSATARQRKIVLLISAIVVASIGCWFPTTAIHMMRWCSPPSIMTSLAGSTIELIHPWLGYFNSLLNPLILLLMNEDFRSTYKQIYGFKNRSSTN